MKRILALLSLCFSSAVFGQTIGGSMSGGDWIATWTVTAGGGTFTVAITGTWTRPDSTANFYVDGFISKGTSAGPSSQSFTHSVSGAVGSTVNVRLFTLSADTGSTYYKFDTTKSFTSTSGPGTTPPASTRKKIPMTWTNPSTTEGRWIGIVDTANPGRVVQSKYVGPGETYSAALSVAAGDTGVYSLVAIDADQAFADGGGAISVYQHPDGSTTYDFTGYTTALGSTYTASANGIAAGQSGQGEQITPTTDPGTTATVGSVALLSNPRLRSTGGVPSGVTPANATSAPDKASQADNTNAITAALKDVKDAIQSGVEISVTPTDMSATNAKLDTINQTLNTGNSKKDTANVHLSDLKTKLDTLNTTTALNGVRIDGTNTRLDTANAQGSATNTKLDGLTNGVSALGTKLDSVVSATNAQTSSLGELVAGQGATNGKLDAIKAAVDTVAGKVQEGNDQRKKLVDFTEGTAASQTGYSNAVQVASAQAAAAAVGAYTGTKPSVAGAPAISVPGDPGDWGQGIQVGNTTITFGAGRLPANYETMMVAGRSLLLVALCLGFMRQASRTLTDYTVALPQVQTQDTGMGPENIGPGVSQAKTYATAAVAVGVIFTGAASIVALIDTFVTYYGGGITSILGSGASLSSLSAIGALDRYVPVAAGLGLSLLGVALPYVVAPMYLATAGILRFIKT